MKNPYYIEYGCSICTEHLVVLAKDEQTALDYAYQEAQNLYYSYDCNYPDMEDYEGMDEEDVAEMLQDEMEQDIQYYAEDFNPENEDHMMTLSEQGNIFYEI